MKIKKSRIQEIIREEIIIVREKQLNESFDKADYEELKDIIRAELAAVFFDLFKKRSIWI